MRALTLVLILAAVVGIAGCKGTTARDTGPGDATGRNDSPFASLIAALGDERPLRKDSLNALPTPATYGEAAGQTLVMIGEPAVEALVAALENKQQPTVVRVRAAQALAAIRCPHRSAADRRTFTTEERAAVWHAAVQALGDENPLVRHESAFLLGQLEEREGVLALLDALHDADTRVRDRAAWALHSIGDVRALDALLSLLSSPSANDRGWSAYAVGGLGDPRAVKPLLLILHDPDPWPRRGAANSLGRLGDRRAVIPLIAVLRDEDSLVRKEAATALGNLDAPEARPALQKARKDSSSDVRRAAEEALQRIPD
jgi:HEAT repeat protein